MQLVYQKCCMKTAFSTADKTVSVLYLISHSPGIHRKLIRYSDITVDISLTIISVRKYRKSSNIFCRREL